MELRKWNSKIIGDLRGVWGRLNLIKALSNRAFQGNNIRFNPGRFTTRDGFGNRSPVAGAVTSMYNWITSSLNELVYLEAGVIKALNIATNAITTVGSAIAGARAFMAAEGNTRLILAFFTSGGLGAAQARILNGSLFGMPADKAFAAPMQVTSITPSDGAAATAGGITAGTHLYGFIMQSRTGFAGRPSPVNGSGTFIPATFTNAGAKKCHLAIVANTPSDASLAYPIMTRADNHVNWYFVPIGANGGDPIGLPPSTAGFSWSWDLDIRDEDLAAGATLADDNLTFMTQDQSGNGPFQPSAVLSYGQRTVYIADNDIWISNSNDSQTLDGALNKIRVPGDRQIITGLVIRGVLYLLGPGWTYATVDSGTGDPPSTWRPPQLISGQVGTRAPKGVTDKTAGNYGWVAYETGLFKFTGVYSPLPITYLDSVWQTINWLNAAQIQVVDDVVAQKVYVAAPVGTGQAEPNLVFIIDYTKGMTPYDVDISYDSFAAFPTFSSIALVQEATDDRSVPWIGPSAAGQIVKPIPAQRFDVASSGQQFAINSLYETGRVLDEGDSWESSRFGRLQATAKGSGQLFINGYSPDHMKAAQAFDATTGAPVALSLTPDKDIDVLIDLADVDNFSISFQTNAIGAWMDVSRLRPWWRAMWQNR